VAAAVGCGGADAPVTRNTVTMLPAFALPEIKQRASDVTPSWLFDPVSPLTAATTASP